MLKRKLRRVHSLLRLSLLLFRAPSYLLLYSLCLIFLISVFLAFLLAAVEREKANSTPLHPSSFAFHVLLVYSSGLCYSAPTLCQLLSSSPSPSPLLYYAPFYAVYLFFSFSSPSAGPLSCPSLSVRLSVCSRLTFHRFFIFSLTRRRFSRCPFLRAFQFSHFSV